MQKYNFFWKYASFFVFLHPKSNKMSKIDDYIEQHSSPEPELLNRIARETHLHVINPHMLSGHVQGRLLAMLSGMIRPHAILELGTYTGYSALCLAEGLSEDGRLISIERNDELEDTIRRHFSQSPLGERITLLIGDAVHLLPELFQKDAGPFDLVFMDADKREYCTYLDLVLPLVRLGGWILADNTLWDGHVTDSAYNRDAQTLGLRCFNDRVAQDDRLEKVIVPIRDGLTLIRKRN